MPQMNKQLSSLGGLGSKTSTNPSQPSMSKQKSSLGPYMEKGNQPSAEKKSEESKGPFGFGSVGAS